jgi:hypothetical protein
MDLGEADRVLTVLTPRLGKLRVVAKGVRRTRSRIGGGLQPFSDVQLVLGVGRTFDVVTSSSLEDPHLGLRNDLHSTAAAWSALAVVVQVATASYVSTGGSTSVSSSSSSSSSAGGGVWATRYTRSAVTVYVVTGAP